MKRYTIFTIICILHLIPRGMGQNFDEDNDDDNRDEGEFKPHREAEKEPDYHNDKEPELNKKQYEAEVKRGNMGDLFGTLDEYHPHKYKELNRRFGNSHKQIRRTSGNDGEKKSEKESNPSTLSNTEEDPKLIPMRAPPEVVLAIVKKSAETNGNASRPSNSTKENLQNYILRSGDYFNGVWKEEVNPDLILRSNNSPKKQKMGSVKARIMPGSKLYNLVQLLTKISPRLLYVINKKD